MSDPLEEDVVHERVGAAFFIGLAVGVTIGVSIGVILL